jgi:hypothetical protein
MANLSSILTDPNYVNANAATKQAIFDKFSAQDTNFTGANPATQDAIRQRFGVSVVGDSGEIPKPRKTGTTIDQIPGSSVKAPASTAAPERPESGFFGKLMAPLETAVTLGTSAITAPIVEGAKIYGTLTSGKFGTQQGIRAGEETGRKVQQFFQPQVSPESERQIAAISNALASTGLQGVPLNMMSNMATLAGPAIQQVAPTIKAPVQARQQRVQAERVAESYKNAPVIDAAQAGQRLGVALNPAESNPTVGNKIKSVLGGNTEIDARLSKFNVQQITDKVRQDLGVAATEKLDDAAINRALDQASAPYDPIRALPVLSASDDVLGSIKALDKPATLGGKSQASAVSALIGDVVTELQLGRSGAQIIDDIRQLRRGAQSVYKARDKGNNPPVADVSRADAQMGIANALEKMIDENAPNPRALSEFQQARQRMAQIYDHERALDYGTGTIDPKSYAKMLNERKGNMTGVGADIGKVAANFPKVVGEDAAAGLKPRLTRSGLGGTLGFIAGTPLGLAVPGAALGAATGYVAGAAQTKRMMSPSYQRKYAMPEDYRPTPSGLRPVEPNVSTNALVPYDYSQQTFTPPNFTIVPEQYGPRATFVGPDTNAPLQIGQGGTMETLAAERARAAGMSRTLGQQAEAQQAAAEAATRRPTRGEVILDINPLTGLPEISKGLKGATPETFSNFGSALETASTKVTAGRLFDMTAAEKVAWNKTKADIAEVAPGFKALSDKAVAEKMMDRAWVEQTATKARQQAAAFEQLAARAEGERARQAAIANRERMLDLVEQMEESLTPPRPTSTGGQGPKTRAFQRNKLNMLSDQDVVNQLLNR